MKKDEGIQWIRDVRRIISHEHGNDPHRFVEFHKNLRSKYKELSQTFHSTERESAASHAGGR